MISTFDYFAIFKYIYNIRIPNSRKPMSYYDCRPPLLSLKVINLINMIIHLIRRIVLEIL